VSAWQGSTRRSRLPTDWPERRRRCFARDRYTCRACGGTRCGNRNLECDHIDGTDNHSLDNLQTLGADPCHREKTQAEALAARTPTRRPRERHPGLR
jgi:5-methylcytosine-specific restriction protein A